MKDVIGKFMYIVPYTEVHIVGQNNGLNNGHIYYT